MEEFVISRTDPYLDEPQCPSLPYLLIHRPFDDRTARLQIKYPNKDFRSKEKILVLNPSDYSKSLKYKNRSNLHLRIQLKNAANIHLSAPSRSPRLSNKNLGDSGRKGRTMSDISAGPASINIR